MARIPLMDDIIFHVVGEHAVVRLRWVAISPASCTEGLSHDGQEFLVVTTKSMWGEGIGDINVVDSDNAGMEMMRDRSRSKLMEARLMRVETAQSRTVAGSSARWCTLNALSDAVEHGSYWSVQLDTLPTSCKTPAKLHQVAPSTTLVNARKHLSLTHLSHTLHRASLLQLRYEANRPVSGSDSPQPLQSLSYLSFAVKHLAQFREGHHVRNCRERRQEIGPDTHMEQSHESRVIL